MAKKVSKEFLDLYSEAVTEGMRQPLRKDEVQTQNDYILYLQGQEQWRPEFAQFTPVASC